MLNDLIARWEGELVEFKRVGEGFALPDTSKYFSALFNKAIGQLLRNLSAKVPRIPS